MYKNKEKQREAVKKAVQKHRTGITQGITSTEGITPYPDIIDKLINKIWRGKLERICLSFKHSHHPSDAETCWLGDNNLSIVCNWLECTA